jgi:pyrroloquinoline quinone biosynthesis protein E
MLSLSSPAIYTLELTSACNNHCPDCSNPFSKEQPSVALSRGEWIQLLEQIGPEATRIRLTGGEPTLHPDFLEILETAAANHAAVSIFTNGRWRKPRELIQQVRNLPMVAGFLVSLHGATVESHESFTRTPGSFVETLANIQMAMDQGVRVALSVVLNRYNLGEIEAIGELAERLGVEHVAFNRFIGPPQSKYNLNPEETRQAFQKIRRLSALGASVEHSICIPQCFISNRSEQCLAGIAAICIDPWGNLRPCLYSKTIVGTVRDGKLIESWRGSALRAWRELIPPGCRQCLKSEVCAGGCRAAGEYQPDSGDQLYQAPIEQEAEEERIVELPAAACPIPAYHLYQEEFGYALLGEGHLIPVKPDAMAVLTACNGENSFADLFAHFSQAEMELLGELWEAGMLDIAA